MDEMVYFNTLANEVLLSDNQRLKDILAWCSNINAAIGACKDHPEKRTAHSAIVASMLIMEAGFVEETHSTIEPKDGTSPFNEKDIEFVRYGISPDFIKRTITLNANVVDFLGNVNRSFTFASLTMKMRELEQPSTTTTEEPVGKIILP